MSPAGTRRPLRLSANRQRNAYLANACIDSIADGDTGAVHDDDRRRDAKLLRRLAMKEIESSL